MDIAHCVSLEVIRHQIDRFDRLLMLACRAMIHACIGAERVDHAMLRKSCW